jgi:RHS repeat-associated protein
MVTSPGGKKTRFEYDPSTGAINKIIDPQGNVTQLFHWIRSSDGAIQTGRIELPDGNGYRFDCSPEFSQNLQRTSPVFSGPSNDSGGRNIHLFPPNVASVGEESYSDIYYQFGSNSIMVVELAPPPGFGQSERKKIYNYENYDLVEESLYFFHYATITNPNSGDLGARDITIKQTGYNFLGNKLEETTKTKRVNYYGQDIEPERVIRTSTAYWGPEKYYQQKAVRVKAGNVTRYSFTDYYPSNAQAGQRGQASLVYDQKYGGITLNTLVALPAWSTPETAWRYQVSVSDPAKFSGSFDYDGQGRPIQVKKLQKVVNGIYHYVQTDSTYGAPGAPTYGGATQVIEDVGGANRLTQTLAFDVAGRSIDTVDGQGRRFVTDYDPDGAIQTITHANAIPPVVIASFDYGTADGTPENGQVLQVTDGLSGTRQTASYIQTGPARGKPHIIFEDLGLGQQTTVEATYNSLGDRILSRVTTPNGTKVTKYKNWTYTSNFAIDKQRLFTRINQQRNVDSNWVDSEEEVRYSFDFMGRLVTVDFAMTPQGGAQDYTVDSPLSFVRARYGYDAGGRITSVDHTWNQLAGSNYAKSAILGTSAEYNSPLALKTATKFWNPNGTNFILHRTESYGYDPDLDYLTSVNYGDGSPQEVWTYDAAGNRASSSATPGAWSYDNLNRMTTSPGSIYTHSAIGNRLSKTTGGQTTTYGWDTLNRLTSISSPSGTTTYQYRADGMRLRKTTSGVTESFYYEGQMPIESAKSGVITRNFLGGRGIEAITTITNTGSNTVYPVYDTHGNMIATVSKGFNGMSWASGNIRTYDVWGGVRAGAPTGGPANRYCANLGHLQDDESGLIYMRARYYEPSSGRFISEDPARDGGNWFRYADNIPSIKIDKTGRVAALAILGLVMLFLAPLVEEGFQQFRYGIWSPERLGVAALHGLLAMVGGAIALAWIAGLGVTAVLSAGSLAPGIFGVLVVVALMFLAYEVFLLIAFADWKDDICELKENATR